MARFGTPNIFNTDQSGQFASQAFTGARERVGVRISMAGRGRFLDDIFMSGRGAH